jgi:hypothetical protein
VAMTQQQKVCCPLCYRTPKQPAAHLQSKLPRVSLTAFTSPRSNLLSHHTPFPHAQSVRSSQQLSTHHCFCSELRLWCITIITALPFSFPSSTAAAAYYCVPHVKPLNHQPCYCAITATCTKISPFPSSLTPSQTYFQPHSPLLLL